MKMAIHTLAIVLLGISSQTFAGPTDYVGVQTGIQGGWNLYWCGGTCFGASSSEAAYDFYSYGLTIDGGLGTRSSDISNGLYNYAQAIANFGGERSLPFLRAVSSVTTASQDEIGDPIAVPHTGEFPQDGNYHFFSSATAEATQYYTYVGTTAAEYTFSLSLVGQDNGGSSFGTMNLYDRTWTPSWNVENDADVRLGDFVVLSMGSDVFGFSTVTLQPGQGFFLSTTLTSSSTAGTTQHTVSIDTELHVSITQGNPALLIPGEVPIPSTVYLMFSGILGLLGLARTRIRKT